MAQALFASASANCPLRRNEGTGAMIAIDLTGKVILICGGARKSRKEVGEER